MLLNTIWRLFVVPFALLLATLAGGAALLTLGQEHLVHVLRGASDDRLFGLLGAVLKIGMALLTPQVLLLPFLVVVAGEVGRIRTPLYYVAAFGLLGALLPIVGKVGTDAVGSMPLVAVFATAGFVAGFTYWLIAWWIGGGAKR